MSKFLSWDPSGNKSEFLRIFDLSDLLTLDSLRNSYHLGFGYFVSGKLAKEYKFSHKKIIIKTNSQVRADPVKRTCFDLKDVTQEEVDWYQLPERSVGKRVLIGPLSERPYIHIIKAYKEIEICSEEKGSRMSIDDLFFASRGLSSSPDHLIKEYNVLRDDGSTLILEVIFSD